MWGWFVELHGRRGFEGMSGLSLPITFQEIKAWSEVTETSLATHEIRLLTQLDNIWLHEERKKRAAEAKRNKGKV